jgi:hypothetical protein
MSYRPSSPLNLADFGNPYLPSGGASVSVLFGVSPGIDTQAFISQYIDPATAIAAGSASLDALTTFVAQYESAIGTPVTETLTPARVWAIFNTLPANQQQLLVEQAFFSILNTTGLDYNNPASATYGQYSAGYQANQHAVPGELRLHRQFARRRHQRRQSTGEHGHA